MSHSSNNQNSNNITSMPDCITHLGLIYEHNLKHIDVSIPRDKLVKVTGINWKWKIELSLRHNLC